MTCDESVVPSTLHDGPLLLIRREPRVLTALLQRIGIELPTDAAAKIGDTDFTQAVALERRADSVVTLEREGRVIEGFIVEVQLRIDRRKAFAWPLYLASLHARLQCPCRLIVIAPTARVARWARQPIPTMQPESPLAPIVLGPEEVPLITRRKEAASFAELAMMSALVHGRSEQGEQALLAALYAADRLDDERAGTYADLLATTHDELVQKYGRPMPLFDYQYQTESAKKHYGDGRAAGRAEGIATGRAEGIAAALLDVIAARKLKLSRQGRKRIVECTDLDALKSWLRRAAVAQTESEIW